MKIGRKIQWLRPYIDAAQPILANFPKLVSIATREPPLTKIATSQAVMLCDDDENYSIVLRTSYLSLTQLKPLKRERRYYTKIDLLCNLAHELAHLDHWDHSTEHKKLEAQLTLIFMDILKGQGYTADENEFGPHQIT